MENKNPNPNKEEGGSPLEPFPLWNFKEVGDKMQYTHPNGSNISYSSVVIQNINWPGATTVYKQGEFFNIYIGFGNKLNGSTYYPLTPDSIEADPEGLTEYKEPNPDKEPEVIESDSDKEVEEEKEMDDN